MKLVPLLLLLLLLLPLCTPFHASPQEPVSPRGGSYHHLLNQDSPLPMLSLVTDSHYSFGFQLGRTFQSRIKQFLADYPTLQKTLVPFVQTPQGRSAFDQFVSTAAAAYPDYLEELRGLSEGAQVPLSLVLLLNLRPELTGLINEQKKEVVTVQDEDASCTDVYLRTERLLMDAHNEDGSPYIRPSAYLVNVTLVEPAPSPSSSSSSYLAIGRKKEERFVVRERWIAYAYPGVLPGNAFAFNGNGVTITMNALYPVNISRTGLGRAFVNRDVLRAKNLKDALRRAIPEDSATGFSINIGSIPEQRLMNVETSPQTFSVHNPRCSFSFYLISSSLLFYLPFSRLVLFLSTHL
ncbi:hypothetical protein QOT17_006250 [Balamuthia mandrillaris]